MPAPDGQSDRIVHFRTLRDYHRLRELAETGDRFAVIGGGFVGSELASALAGMGKRVTMIFASPGIGSRIFPVRLALWLNGYFSARGVEVVSDAAVTGVHSDDRGATVSFETARGARTTRPRRCRVHAQHVRPSSQPNGVPTVGAQCSP